MSTASTCSNPLCTCDPCTCGDDCRCGTVKLGQLEQQVMDVLWSSPGDELSARDVTDRLDDYALTTISTVLDRLSHKGLVRRRNQGRAVLFSSVDTEVGHAAALMREALATTEQPAQAIVQFVRRASKKEVAAMQRALQPTDRAN